MTVVRPAEALTVPLDRLRRKLRRALVVESTLLFLLAVVVGAAVGFVLDYELFLDSGFDWVLDAPAWLRGAALGAFVVGAGGWWFNRVAFSGRGDYSYASLALLLEKRFPTILREKLITAVELADVDAAEKSGTSGDLVRRTIDDAAKQLKKIRPESIINRGRFAMLWLAILGTLGMGATALLIRNALALGTIDPMPVLVRTIDSATIFAERNVLLRPTPWMRNTHLEILEPTKTEYRIGRDAGAPRVRVRAHEWVVADATVRLGWRPLIWGDLEGLAVDAAATLDMTEQSETTDADTAVSALLGGTFFAVIEKRPIVKTIALAALPLDEIVATFGADHAEVAPVLAELDAKAASFSMSRILRRLPPTDTVDLRYFGIAGTGSGNETKVAGGTRGAMKLTREPNGDYGATLANLKESISYTVRANDFRTDPRRIVLVPPPLLAQLKRVEEVPAYHLHPAPVEGGAAQWPALKSLRQTLAPKEFSLTGERSVASIPVGSEVEISGTADKELAEVILIPKVGRMPGATTATEAVSVTPEGESFRFAFRGADRLDAGREFDLVLVDLDGVRSKRTVVLQAVEDMVPEVRIAVSVLREFAGGWLCTPKAMVPFLKESIVRDDVGLSRVDFEFQISLLESQAVQALQFEANLGRYSFAPLMPNLGSNFAPAIVDYVATTLGQGEQKQFGTLPVRTFERSYETLPKSTTAGLLKTLSLPRAGQESPNVVKEVRFSLESDVFDLLDVDGLLEVRGRRLQAKESTGEVQQRFRLDLTVAAADTNVVRGPRVGRNLEAIRLFIVSEADLLSEITKDEEKITARFDEALKRLREAQVKLNGQAQLLSSASLNPQALLSARVRAEDLVQEAAKSRDLLQSVIADYTRLKREVETNRCNPGVSKRYESVVLTPLDQVLAAEHKAADDALAAFREPLNAGIKPEDSTTANAKVTLEALIRRLEQIRRELGDTVSEGKLRDDLRRIIENQRVVSDALVRVIQGRREQLNAPVIQSVPTVMLERGATLKVTHAVDWKFFTNGELKIRLEASVGSELSVPAELIVKDDRDNFDWILTAGRKPGSFTVTLRPSVGPAVVVAVVVK